MEPIFCLFTQQFHEEQTTEAYSLWTRNNEAVCRLKSVKELLEEEVVNCTTSLEREELNKRSSHMIRIRMKRRSNKPEAKKLLLVKETVIRWQMTC